MDYTWRNTDFGIPDQIGGLATLNDYPYTDGGGTGTDTCEAANHNASVFLKEPRVVSESFLSTLLLGLLVFFPPLGISIKPFFAKQ